MKPVIIDLTQSRAYFDKSPDNLEHFADKFRDLAHDLDNIGQARLADLCRQAEADLISEACFICERFSHAN